MNPLLACDALPAFDRIQPEHIQPAIEQALSDCRQVVAQALAAESISWDSVVLPLEEANDRLSRIWAPISHLNAVCSTPALRQAHDACLPLLSEYHTWLGQHQGLYQRYQQLHDSQQFGQWPAAQQQALALALRDFRLTGVALAAADKQRYAAIAARLSELGAQFANQLLDATQAWNWHCQDAGQLPGLPSSALEAAAARAQAAGREGYLFTLDLPAYLPVITYCQQRELRREFYQAYATRASELGPNGGEFDNGPLMRELLALRHEQAQLLGFANFAELSLAAKMAPSTTAVEQFLLDLAARARPQAEADLAELRRAICDEVLTNPATRIVEFDLPVRDETILDYKARVEDWHDRIAGVWAAAMGAAERVALLVWGDPALYDSTLRIAARLQTGYLYSYALVMLLGLTAAISWVLVH